MNRRFVKKPLEIDAFRYCFDVEPEWCEKSAWVNHCQTHNDMWLEIETLEGIMKAMPGDYIIKGIKGEIYPCKSDIFLESYQEVHCPYVAIMNDPIDVHSWNQRGTIIPISDDGV